MVSDAVRQYSAVPNLLASQPPLLIQYTPITYHVSLNVERVQIVHDVLLELLLLLARVGVIEAHDQLAFVSLRVVLVQQDGLGVTCSNILYTPIMPPYNFSGNVKVVTYQCADNPKAPAESGCRLFPLPRSPAEGKCLPRLLSQPPACPQ